MLRPSHGFAGGAAEATTHSRIAEKPAQMVLPARSPVCRLVVPRIFPQITTCRRDAGAGGTSPRTAARPYDCVDRPRPRSESANSFSTSASAGSCPSRKAGRDRPAPDRKRVPQLAAPGSCSSMCSAAPGADLEHGPRVPAPDARNPSKRGESLETERPGFPISVAARARPQHGSRSVSYLRRPRAVERHHAREGGSPPWTSREAADDQAMFWSSGALIFAAQVLETHAANSKTGAEWCAWRLPFPDDLLKARTVSGANRLQQSRVYTRGTCSTITISPLCSIV